MRIGMFCAALLALATPALAAGTGGPYGWVQLDNEKFDLQFEQISDMIYSIVPQEFVFGDGSVRVAGRVNLDPSISLSLVFTDLNAPTSLVASIAAPLGVPIGVPNVASSALSGSMMDATGDGVSLAPLGGPVLEGFPDLSMSPWLGVGIGTWEGHGPAEGGATYPYGPYAAGPVAGPGPGPWNWLILQMAFKGSGGGDEYQMDGLIVFEPGRNEVPEPGALALALAAVVPATVVVRRKMAARRAM